MTKNPIQQYRAENNLTQAEMGKLLGVSGPTVTRYENGQRLISVKHIKEFERILGVPREALRPDVYA